MGGGGGREIIYLSLHCHHQNELCIKMGSESQFNVSLIVRDKVTKSVHKHDIFEDGEKRAKSGIDPSPFCLPA